MKKAGKGLMSCKPPPAVIAFAVSAMVTPLALIGKKRL
jgi:hypothetical protein